MTGMSKAVGNDKENSKEVKGVAKTEVPTKVHWAKREYFTLLPIITDNNLKLLLVILALPRISLPSVTDGNYVLPLYNY